MVDIRSLKKEDLAQICDVIVGHESTEKYLVEWEDVDDCISFRLQLCSLSSPFSHSWQPTPEDIAHYEKVVEQGTCLAAWEDNVLAGVAIAEPQAWNRSLMLWEFHVRKEHHRRGIGWLMMEEMVIIAREKGMRVIVCETQNTNVPAIRFYHAMGFTLDGIDISYYSNHDLEKGMVALFMKRKVI